MDLTMSLKNSYLADFKTYDLRQVEIGSSAVEMKYFFNEQYFGTTIQFNVYLRQNQLLLAQTFCVFL